MARAVNRLTTRFVATCNQVGRYADGNGLYLRVTPTQKSWTYMFKWQGKQTEIGLGSAQRVSLADARRKAADARKMTDDGLHPRAETKLVAVPTFGEFCDEFINMHESGWKNAKHISQWKMTLGRTRNSSGQLLKTGYCLGLADIPVDLISVDEVLAELKNIWTLKPETASRIRGRIEAVLDAATARKLRSGSNPAAWRGNLATLLPSPKKTRIVKHFSAMPYSEISEFYERLSSVDTLGSLALRFTILTAARSGETRGARWSEIDFDKKIWSIPAARMKAAKPHRVPLSNAAIELLAAVGKLIIGSDSLIFPGVKNGATLSDMTLTATLRRMGLGHYTVHGFRSTFRDWAGDETSHPRELIEQSLAHVVGGVEGAYRRSDALERRRIILDDWAQFLAGK